MDVAAFCRQSRVLVVAGKGGVGKTTITAALARMAARAGLDVLVVELEGKVGVPAAFGGSGSLGYDPSALTALRGAGSGSRPPGAARAGAGGQGTVHARRITPDDALLEYLADHGMGRISKRLVSSGALDVVATAIPGIRDILVLGKIKQLERDPAVDLILVDAPATGHAMTFLSSAHGLLDAARSGPVRAQAADVVELLTDPERCQVALVTLPEEMPVNEVIEAAYQLEDRVGLTLGPVIVNACLADEPALSEDPAAAAGAVGVSLTDDQVARLSAAAAFHTSRFRLQQQQRDRLAQDLPLHQLVAPFVFNDTLGPQEIERIADSLAAAVERYGTDSQGEAAPSEAVP
ncbi:MAG TPA: ArsA-related P-loop ATPase [Acidimicrobiales bacterium]|nr:ArsA-related P-loop ATPase [Acidimicrobiales bacterium]